LHEQIAADSLRRFFESLGGNRQSTITDQTDQTVAQVFALDEHENHQHDHQPA
jgi:hypothetical protein